MLEMGRRGEERRGEGRREEMMRSLAGTFFWFSFLLPFGIIEYEIAARTSQVKPKNPSPT